MFCKECCSDTKYNDKANFVVCHLKKIHNLSFQEYYDKHEKLDNEGKCKICGAATKFYNDGHYSLFCSNQCLSKYTYNRSDIQDIIDKRAKKIKKHDNTKKIETSILKIMKRFSLSREDAVEKIRIINERKRAYIENKKEKYKKIECKICSQIFYSNYDNFTRCHLKIKHSITAEDYFNQFFGDADSGKCKQCGSKTKFVSIILGYKPYCSHACYSKDSSVIEKREKTNMKLYGTKNPMMTDGIKEKVRITCVKKYGKFYCQTDEFKQKIKEKKDDTDRKARKTHEKNGRWIPLKKCSRFSLYRRIVIAETRKHRKILFEQWDGTDFYSGESLKTKKQLVEENPGIDVHHLKCYPTVDHKISVLNGFLTGRDPKDIGSIDNLCITSRSNNSSKRERCSLEFLDEIRKI